MMKRLLRVYLTLCLFSFVAWSCSDDDDECPSVENTEEVRYTDVDGAMIINTKDLVIGETADEPMLYEKQGSTLSNGDIINVTDLDCYGLLAAHITDGKIDTENPVNNVTIINRGKITVHTKALYERYKDLIQDTDNPDRPYEYLRVIVMYGGKNSTIINEGTIEVHFDHDSTALSTIYCIAMSGEEGTMLLNRGTIKFTGNGSLNTRMRCMAAFADSITNINEGDMIAKVTMCNDTRMITSGGTRCNIFNNKLMRIENPRIVRCMTRFGDSNIANNGTIEITAPPIPEVYGASLRNNACAMYEGMSEDRTVMPPMINRGEIKFATDPSNKQRTNLVGMFFELNAVQHAKDIPVGIINEGTIDFDVPDNLPSTVMMSEVSTTVSDQQISAGEDPAYSYTTLVPGRWRTKLRDFSKTPYLFAGMGINMNLSGAELLIERPSDYVSGTEYSIAPESLVTSLSSDYYYGVTGYESMIVTPYDEDWTFNWDTENRKVSYTSK